MRWTDERADLLQELLNGMRIIKYFCYEVPFLDRECFYHAMALRLLTRRRIGINHVRRQELKGILKIQYIKAAGLAIAFTVPTLASVLAFVVYALAGHGLQPAIIFTSLSYFTLLRQPLLFFPRAYVLHIPVS